MNDLSIFVKIKVKPGQRDQARLLWEKHLKPRAQACEALSAYFYAYDDHDENAVWVFENYTDRKVFEQNVKEPWLAAYVAEVAPLLDGEPQVRFSTPVWVK